MKKALGILLLTAAMGIAACGSLKNGERQTTVPQTAPPSPLAQSADDTHWHIDITTMNTLRYGSRMVTPDFFLEMRGDTLVSYLPYLGQAQRSSYGDTEGVLNFQQTVKDLKITKPKKHYTRLEMRISKISETLRYIVELEETGRATIRVYSNDRDAISFDGEVNHEN